MKRLRVAIAAGAFLLGASLLGITGGIAAAQISPIPASAQTPIPQNPQLPSIDGRNANNNDTFPPSILARQAKMRNDARQQQMVSDTDKLVELATKLKQEMGKSGKDVDPDDVAKKAEEIEKLARSVKDHMKG